jgi:hypothetical protein
VEKAGKQMKREWMKREPRKREPMKTLSQRLQQILDKISRAFPPQLFPVPAPVRAVNRSQSPSPLRRRP